MDRITFAPVIISVYDRVDHFRRCVESLLLNDLASETSLYIVSDAAFKEEHACSVEKVREYASSISGFKEVHLLFREKNLGAHESIKSAIEEVLLVNESFVFLEDDIVVSEDFLQYMNDGLNYYRDEKNIFAVCGFSLPFSIPEGYDNDVYFYPCNSPWGFGAWRDRWMKVNLDYYDREADLKKDNRKYKEFTSVGFYIKGILRADSEKKIAAMDLRVYYHMFQHRMCSVFPVVSKTQNWGFDGTGEHCGNKKVWWAKPDLDVRNKRTNFVLFSGYNKMILINHRKFQEKINGGIMAKWFKYTWAHKIWIQLKKRIM